MVILPASGPKPLYYKTFIGFFKNILKYNNIGFECDGTAEHCYFETKINNKTVVFNFSDFYEVPNANKYDYYFKYHYSHEEHVKSTNIFPFSPVSFYNWQRQRELAKEIRYNAGDYIAYIQRAHFGATKRRKKVKEILKNEYTTSLITGRKSQGQYWRLINKCIAHVFVPGAREGILDRAHLQYLAFGCCTISPEITDVLPYNKRLLHGIHYIVCKDDFSDLIEKIEWCKNHKEHCIKIGNNAKALFRQACEPNVLWNWILENIR